MGLVSAPRWRHSAQVPDSGRVGHCSSVGQYLEHYGLARYYLMASETSALPFVGFACRLTNMVTIKLQRHAISAHAGKRFQTLQATKSPQLPSGLPP